VEWLRRRGPYLSLLLAVIAANFALDRLTKHLALAFLKGQDALSLAGGLILVRYAENTGAFLSLGAGWDLLVKYVVLLALPIAVCAGAFFYLALRETDRRRLVMIACIIGGGVGNLADRLFNNFRVIDFLNFGLGRLRTGVLNVADLSVTFGALALLLYTHRERALREKIPRAMETE